MSETLLKALDYGVLGLCAVMVVFAARIIYKEQSREDAPKPELLRFVSLFLGFCILIVIINAYVQIYESKLVQPEVVEKLSDELKAENDRKIRLKEKLIGIKKALDQKENTELRSLLAVQDPAIRERLSNEIRGLKERVLAAQKLLDSD